MIWDLDYVQVACPKDSEEEARRFYGELLELEEIDKPESLKSRGGCWFRVGARQLHLGVEEQFRAATKAHPAFAVADAMHLQKNLEAAGVTCVQDNALPEVQRFYAFDPWGNRLEFIERTGP